MSMISRRRQGLVGEVAYTENSNVWIGSVGAASVVVCDAVKSDPWRGHVSSASGVHGIEKVGSVYCRMVVVCE
jgi:hypothetical protein